MKEYSYFYFRALMKNINAQFHTCNEKTCMLRNSHVSKLQGKFLKWVVLTVARDSFTDLTPNVK